MKVWAEEFNKARSDEKRQVPMLYLANEVLHTGTKKCPDWVQHFASHLPGCLSKLPTGSVVHQKAQRLAQIWRERDILGTGISKVYQVLGVAGPSAPPAAGRPSRAPSKGPKSPSKGGQKGAAAGEGAGNHLSPEIEGALRGVAAAGEEAARVTRRCESALKISLTVSGSIEDIAEAQGMLGLFDEALGAQLKAQKALVDAAKAYVEKQNDVAAQIAQQQRKGQQQQIALQKRIDKLMGGGPEDAPAEAAGAAAGGSPPKADAAMDVDTTDAEKLVSSLTERQMTTEEEQALAAALQDLPQESLALLK